MANNSGNGGDGGFLSFLLGLIAIVGLALVLAHVAYLVNGDKLVYLAAIVAIPLAFSSRGFAYCCAGTIALLLAYGDENIALPATSLAVAELWRTIYGLDGGARA